MADYGPRKMLRNFSDALRKSELRDGNQLPIRYCGVLEFGETFGRPHYHILLYNMVKNRSDPLPYQRGLPRTLFNTSLWPHGHVDVAQFNPSTIAYILKYIFKDSRTGEPSIPFRTIRPAIGSYGIVSLAESVVKKHTTMPGIPTSFKYRNRTYIADAYTRKTFKEAYQRLGGKIPEQSLWDKKMQNLLLDEELDKLPWHLKNKTWERARQIEFLQNQKKKNQTQREEKVSASALKRAYAAFRDEAATKAARTGTED